MTRADRFSDLILDMAQPRVLLEGLLTFSAQQIRWKCSVAFGPFELFYIPALKREIEERVDLGRRPYAR